MTNTEYQATRIEYEQAMLGLQEHMQHMLELGAKLLDQIPHPNYELLNPLEDFDESDALRDFEDGRDT